MATIEAALESARFYKDEIDIKVDTVQTKYDRVTKKRSNTANHFTEAKLWYDHVLKYAAQIGPSANSSITTANNRLNKTENQLHLANAAFNLATASNTSAQNSKSNTTSQLEEGEESNTQAINESYILKSIIFDLEEQEVEAQTAVDDELQQFPGNPFPEDQDLYFGRDSVKLIRSDGRPVLFQLSEDGSYKPVTDNGSYTDTIVFENNTFRLVYKNGETQEFTPDGKGNAYLAKQIDTNGNEIQYIGTDGVIDEIIDAVNRTTSFTYDESGHIKEVVDPQGNSHQYNYEDGRLVSYTDPMGYIWSYQYDESNRLISRNNPLGDSYSYEYDSEGRVAKETDELGYEISYIYDPENQVTTMTDRRGHITKYYYNDNNRLEQVFYHDNSSVSYSYDGRNNMISSTDQIGNVTTYDYSDKNDVIKVVNALGETTEITYEPNYNKIATVTDPRGNIRNFSYEANGNLATITHPDGISRTMSYNTLGLPDTLTDERGNISSYGYDQYGQFNAITYADGSTSSFVISVLLSIQNQQDISPHFQRFKISHYSS